MIPLNPSIIPSNSLYPFQTEKENKIPHFNAGIYLENKKKIGKVDEVSDVMVDCYNVQMYGHICMDIQWNIFSSSVILTTSSRS